MLRVWSRRISSGAEYLVGGCQSVSQSGGHLATEQHSTTPHHTTPVNTNRWKKRNKDFYSQILPSPDLLSIVSQIVIVLGLSIILGSLELRERERESDGTGSG